MAKIANLKVTLLTPIEHDKDIIKLLPKTLTPYEAVFEIHGVSVAVANGLRRVILTELPVKAMWFEFDDFTTTNPFTLNDFTQTRVRHISVDQAVDIKWTGQLNVKNTTENLLLVKSGDIKASGQLPFNETFTLAALEPNKEINIKKITIKTDYGYNFAGHQVACNAVCIPLDATPYNGFTKTGTKSSVSDPRKHKITYISNGNMMAKKVIVAACAEIITRLNLIYDVLGEIHKASTQDTYILVINGETDTIGNIIMKNICELFPDIIACVYDIDDISQKLTIRLRTNQDPKTIIKSALDFGIKTFEMLQKSV